MIHFRILSCLCIIGVLQTVPFRSIWKNCGNRKLNAYRGLNSDIIDKDVYFVDKPNTQVHRSCLKMSSVVIEKMYDDKSVKLKLNSTLNSKMPFVDTITLTNVLKLVCLFLLVFTPDNMLLEKISILDKSNLNENEMCWKKGKSAYDSIFSFRKLPQSLIIAMLPSSQRQEGNARDRSTAKKIGSNDIPTYRNARHRDYIEKKARDDSFYNWPGTDSPDTDSLSYAGFYYIGHADTVRCFCCGGGLSGIESDTDPLVEHLKYYPSCEYINHITGNRQSGPEIDSPGAAAEGHDSKPPSSYGERRERSSYNYKPHEKPIPRPDDTTTKLQKSDIKDLLAKGVSRKQIEDLILRQLSNNYESTTDSLYLNLQSNEPENIAVATGDKTSEQPSINQDVKQASPVDGAQCVQGGHEQMHEYSHIEEENQSSKARKENESGVSKLKRENHQLKEQMLCKICLDKTASVVFLNCGHMVSCPECSPHIRKCPMCRKLIKGRIQVS